MIQSDWYQHLMYQEMLRKERLEYDIAQSKHLAHWVKVFAAERPSDN